MKWFYKLERKFGRYAISNLMYYVIILYAVGFLLNVFAPGFYETYLSLSPSMILKGQVWRLVTFIIEPPDTRIIFIIFSMYLYYMIGSSLERTWGSFRFNVYFFMGMILHIIAAFLIYIIWGIDFPLNTYYLNMSLFLAFAATYPDMQLMLFFIIPIKIKWLAIIDAVYFGLTIVFGFLFTTLENVAPALYVGLFNLGIMAHPLYATAALVSLLNFIVFFFMTRNVARYSPKEIRRKMVYTSKVKSASKGSRHKCAICGQTEANENLTFRYCSKCDGNYEYCQEHLYTHQHIKNDNEERES